MNLTIVKPDNLIIVEDIPLRFDLAVFTPENLHALQWAESIGHLEFTDKDNESINELPEWSEAVIKEHQRLYEEQQQEQEKQARQSIFLVNGQARQQRIEHTRNTSLMKQQQKINDYVLEQM